jgi:hypothetical protein
MTRDEEERFYILGELFVFLCSCSLLMKVGCDFQSVPGMCHKLWVRLSACMILTELSLAEPTEQVSPAPSPEDGNRSSLRNVVFFSVL